MLKNLALLSLLFFLVGCYDEKTRNLHLSTTPICDKIYEEVFNPIASNPDNPKVFSYWITDSSTFRIFVGSYDLNETIAFQCVGDTLKIWTLPSGFTLSRLNSKKMVFSIDSLRKTNSYVR